MTARQKLGDLIRSIDYSKAKREGNAGPNSPSTKLKELKKQCKADITFDELKDAYAAFEKKVCIKGFPEAGTQGSDIAYTTLDVIEKLMSKFVEENGHKSEYAWEIRFNTLMALIQAGPNTSHVALLWNFMEDSYGIEAHIQGLEKSDVGQLLKTLKIPFKYTPNNECDEKTFASTLRTRLSDILEMINTEQYELAQKEFLDLYLYYNSLMPTLSERLAKEMYRIVRNMVEKYSDENPYLGLKDPGLIKKHLNVIQEMACSKNFKKDGPISDAAKNMTERISAAVIRNGMVPELFDHIMDMIIKIYKNENGSKEGGDIVDKVRVYLIREIEEREMFIAKELILVGDQVCYIRKHSCFPQTVVTVPTILTSRPIITQCCRFEKMKDVESCMGNKTD